MSQKCETCKHGIAQLANFNAWKDKKMSYTELLLKQASYGGICVKCVYATIGQKQVRKLKKRQIRYHTEDCYVPIESETSGVDSNEP